MTETLSKKFVMTAMTAISILLILLIGTINIINLVNTDKREWQQLETISRVSEISKQDPEGRPKKPEADPNNSDKKEIPDNSGAETKPDNSGAETKPDNSGAESKPGNSGAENQPDDSGAENQPDDSDSENSVENGGENGGESDQNPPQQIENNEYDTYMASNFFFVDYDKDGNVSNVDVSRTTIVDEEEATEMADAVIASGETEGEDGDCIYTLREVEETGECSVVFLDTSNNKKMTLFVLGVSLLVGLVCWLLMLLITILLSKKAIKPIAENIERQKQFVTDAGHELKTPLAIIQSNADAMELYNGENKWTGNIKTQVERMTKLTNDLLALARMDEKKDYEKRDNVNLSEELESITEGFGPSCEKRGMSINSDIAEDIFVRAKRTDLEKLIGILIDNAAKYGKPDSVISVKLSGDGGHPGLSNEGGHATLIVENEVEELPDVEPAKLFERFYRTDKARTQESGGCGIGLSIAKSIIDAHDGQIRAEYVSDKSIRFIVELRG